MQDRNAVAIRQMHVRDDQIVRVFPEPRRQRARLRLRRPRNRRLEGADSRAVESSCDLRSPGLYARARHPPARSLAEHNEHGNSTAPNHMFSRTIPIRALRFGKIIHRCQNGELNPQVSSKKSAAVLLALQRSAFWYRPGGDRTHDLGLKRPLLYP
jgi:hypothetical protein